MPKSRDLAVAVLAAFLAAAAMTTPAFDRMEGSAIDSLFWLRQAIFEDKQKPIASPTVVIAIDEETYQRPPFRGLPKVMWTKQLAKIIDNVVAGGAKVIGFDVVFPATVQRHVPNFDRDFLIALRRAGRAGKLVLGKVQHQAKPVSPHPAQSYAVGHQKNIRAVNVFEDDDGVIRRIPLTFVSDDLKKGKRTDSSMAVELAVRAHKAKLARQPEGSFKLGEAIIPGSNQNTLTLNFESGAGAIPTYSFADLAACAQEGNSTYFKEHFDGKIVMLGTVLDVEDRKLTSKRFITGAEGTDQSERCQHQPMKNMYRAGLVRDSIPGVYIHATAVNNLIRGDALQEMNRWQRAGVTLAVALLTAILTISFAPLTAGLATIASLIVWIGVAGFIFHAGVVAPLFDPLIAAALVFVLLLGYRFAVTDKDKRYIRKVFSLYLPPTVIAKMTESDQMPTLGGEAKEVTILFSDIAKFSTFSEQLTASEVAQFLNEYLTIMSDIIEDHGGFIEKFVADEITAVFGAPLDDPDHALHAVQAGLACANRLSEMKGAFGLPADKQLQARTGINTGEMLVGNIGSYRRFNYAAMGDAANLGSRLEGANKFFDTWMMAGERTAELCGDRMLFREVDSILVMGRKTPTRTFEPLGEPGTVAADILVQKEAYEEALALYRQGDFAVARDKFNRMIDSDPVSRIMSERCLNHLAQPPENWDGSFVLGSK